MANREMRSTPVVVLLIVVALSVSIHGQAVSKQQPANTPPVAAAAPPVPPSYVIGVEDVLTIVFWRDKDMSGEVVVRPDGKISLPLLNDVPAVGLTPEQLAAALKEGARKYIRDADATVMVKEIHSRKVFVIGEVTKPGTIQLGRDMTVLQALGEAGGFLEHANKGDVVIVRNENGSEQRFKFNYNEVVRGKKTEQNIMLRPGDTILVR
jgi:polysaccharide export outer membrane protein